MLLTPALVTSLAALATAQTLNIPTRSGSIVSFSSPSVISGSVDYGNREFDRGRDCNTDADTGSENAVFILRNGASISNVIIGARQLEGIHCEGACTLRNVWFRDVCEGMSFRSPRFTDADRISNRRRLRSGHWQRPLGRRRCSIRLGQSRPA